MEYLCKYISEQYCATDFPWLQLLTPIAIGMFVSLALFFAKNIWRVVSLHDIKYWGLWYRYGTGFYESNGKFPFHSARVIVFPFFPSTMIISWNETYKYIGRIDSDKSKAFYIIWSGIFHREKMLSVYNEPLVVNKNTYLIGVKSCISKNWKPAANAEILSKSKMSRSKAESILKPYKKILVEEGVNVSANYEEHDEA